MSYEVASLQVGKPRTIQEDPDETDWPDREWETGFIKNPVENPIRLGLTNFDGDGQADRDHHGGPDKAVLAYSANHYSFWREKLDRDGTSFPYGSFGENITVSGLTEEEVCIGDVYELGQARVQVSQPRQPCWKLARRWNRKELVKEVERTGRTGWYLRVLDTGLVGPNSRMALVRRPYSEWSVARANTVNANKTEALPEAEELASIPLLSLSWRETLADLVEGNKTPDDTERTTY